MNVDAATQTMIDNLPARTGRSLEQWFTVLDDAALAKHGEAMALLKTEHGVSHGFANLVVLLHRDRAAGAPSYDELVDAQYAGTRGLASAMRRCASLADLAFDDRRGQFCPGRQSALAVDAAHPGLARERLRGLSSGPFSCVDNRSCLRRGRLCRHRRVSEGRSP